MKRLKKSPSGCTWAFKYLLFLLFYHHYYSRRPATSFTAWMISHLKRFNWCVSLRETFFSLHSKVYAIILLLRLPFNSKTLFGYMCCYVFQAVGNFCICFTTVPTNVFIIGTCLLINSFVDDIKEDLSKLKVTKPSTGAAKDKELRENFAYIVQTYSSIKQLSRNSAID